MGKIVKITCRGASSINLSDLTEFQGSLKSLPEGNYKKLKQAILDYGFSFPLSIWKSDDTNYCIDGHQRDRVLKRMREEGYEIPKLPCDFIEAVDMKEAKQKLLLATSVYGKINMEGLEAYIKEAEIEFADIKDSVSFPEIDLSDFAGGFPKGDKLPDVDIEGESAPTGEYIAIVFKNKDEYLMTKKQLGMNSMARSIGFDEVKKAWNIK